MKIKIDPKDCFALLTKCHARGLTRADEAIS